MAFFDLPLEQLQTYQPSVMEPADFDTFWQYTLAETRAAPLNARFEKVDYGLTAQATYDVTFSGFGGQPVKGWLLLPAHQKDPMPCVVEYIGYGVGAVSRLTGCFGRAPVSPTLSWIRAGRAAVGFPAIRPTSTQKAAIRMCRAA